jgi:dethiobiotin synthetase
MKRYFITGTDTGVGKTLTSAVITYALKACYWKPIQSGIAEEPLEQEKIQSLTGLPEKYFFASNYALKAGISPDQAAKRENITINMQDCIVPETNNHLIVEGAGGVFVPLNYKQSLLDLMKQLNFPVIIVARGTLGTINHTLLTIAALRHYQLPIKGIVFSGDLNTESQHTIEQWGQVKTLFHIPRFDSVNSSVLQTWTQAHQEMIEGVLQ